VRKLKERGENMEKSKWKVLKSEDVSPSKWFPIVKDEVELPNGKVIEYYTSQLPPVAMVVAITKENELIFVRQYKHGIGEMCIEFPAGRIEDGHTPEEAAIAELSEETGISVDADCLVKLVELWTEPSKSSVRVTGFFVKDVTITQNQQLEESEDIEVLKVPLVELNSFILENEIHASDALALLLFARMKFPEEFCAD